jgi:hypothetical protein
VQHATAATTVPFELNTNATDADTGGEQDAAGARAAAADGSASAGSTGAGTSTAASAGDGDDAKQSTSARTDANSGDGAMAEGSGAGGGDDAGDEQTASGDQQQASGDDPANGRPATVDDADARTSGVSGGGDPAATHDPATLAAFDELGARGEAAGSAGRANAQEPLDVPPPAKHGAGHAPAAVHRRALVQREPDRPAAAALLGPGWSEINEPGIVKDDTGANLRTAPSGSAPFTHLPAQTKVHILSHNAAARWFAVVTGEGQLGYIADWLLFRHVPEPGANVYLIKAGDTPLDIARTHYGRDFTRWGQDPRFVVNALVFVNSRAQHNGTGDSGLAKPHSVSEAWFRTQAKANVYIWLPSTDYLNSIYEEVRKRGGGTGSISFDFLAKIAGKLGQWTVVPSYIGGLAHGFTSCVADTVKGIFELVENIFTGEIIGQLKGLWDALKKLTWDDLVAAFGSWVTSWKARLLSDNPFVRGHAWGYLAGYLIGEIALFAIGGEAMEALKASKLATRVGQVLSRVAPRLIAGINRLRAIGGAAFEAASEAVARRYGQVVKVVAEILSKLEVRRLATILGKTELDALLPHVKVPRRLLTMVDQVGEDTFAKMVRQWQSKGQFDKMNQFLERMAGGAGRELAEKAPLGAKSVIIDSNTAIALLKDAEGLALQPGETAWVAHIKKLPPGTELRVANVSVGEIGAGKIAVRGLPLDVLRESTEYRRMIAKLEHLKIGGAKGAADQAIVADAFFARAEHGAARQLVTADKNVYNKLAEQAGINPAKLGKPVSKAFPSGFDVTIDGRTLRVIPIGS